MRSRIWSVPLFLLAASCPGPVPETPEFAARIQALSGPGGYFDTDNLISNERSYLHAVSDLRAAGVRGGVYLGVGPDQNFSYIAEVEPELAIIVDIRPDNILQHLLFKALFHASRNRAEYLALLTGRPLAGSTEEWTDAPVDSLLAHLGGAVPTRASRDHARSVVRREIARFGVPLDDGRWETLERFHGDFIEGGLSLRFRSHGRAPQFYYPTLGELLAEVDREGRQVSYVATEERWRRVKRLQTADRVVPIAGDLAGSVALRRVADYLDDRELQVTAFYTSNVEFYLFRNGFASFVENLRALPLAPQSVLIKSFFRGFRGRHPLQLPGYYSTQLVQGARALVEGWDAGRYRTYWEVVTEDLILSSPGSRPEVAPVP